MYRWSDVALATSDLADLGSSFFPQIAKGFPADLADLRRSCALSIDSAIFGKNFCVNLRDLREKNLLKSAGTYFNETTFPVLTDSSQANAIRRLFTASSK